MKILPIILFLFVIDLYFYLGTISTIKTFVNNSIYPICYWLISALIYAAILYVFLNYEKRTPSIRFNDSIVYSSLVFIVFIAKFIGILPLFIDDVIRIFKYLTSFFVITNQESDLGRLNFLKKSALVISGTLFSTLLYGMIWGRYNFKKNYQDIFINDWPVALNNYKIIHISDLHLGSFNNIDKFNEAVEMINAENADLVVFTGDLVNNRADEMIRWKDSFTKLKARDGLFSILGNHDYGDYTRWETEELKKLNFQNLINIQKEIGFDLLLNESRFIEKDNQRIAIIGVENWGKGFKQKGDLKKASEIIDPKDFKILLSHDPSHWEYQVVDDEYHYHLTLSGHTHGMQFGIEIPGLIKWSPVKWRYKYWAGIYEKNKQFINVNRGFGVLAYPGRVGIWPEITVIELKKGQQPA